METAQERELHGRQAWWSLDTLACGLDASTSSSCSFPFEWDPQLRYFGQGSVGIGASNPAADESHGPGVIVPKCMEYPLSEASTAATGLPTAQDVMAMPEELYELLQSLWDSDEEQAVGFSSCCALKEASAMSAFQHDHHFALTQSSISPTSPTLTGKTLMQPPAELPSPSSSQRDVDPRTSDTGGVGARRQGTRCTSKRSASEDTEMGGGRSSKRGRPVSSTAGGGTVARPFTVVKPGGVDGDVTLAEINEWILTPPARPIRHPVGKFAYTPRVSAGNRPAPSGKRVAGFTRLHTAGRGTITIVRTRG